MRSYPCLRAGKRPLLLESPAPVVISEMMMPTASHAGTPTTPAPTLMFLNYAIVLGPFHSPQAGLGIISLLRKKLCKSFHPLRCAQGPLTWVDILICCRQSLPAAPAPCHHSAESCMEKKREADEASLTRRQWTTIEPQKVPSRVLPVMRFECARTAECLGPTGRRDF